MSRPEPSAAAERLERLRAEAAELWTYRDDAGALSALVPLASEIRKLEAALARESDVNVNLSSLDSDSRVER